MRYGIANRAGQVERDAAEAIIARAHASGFDLLDTAVAYGDSERRLGEIGVADWKIVSKLPAAPAGCSDFDAWALECLESSLRRLRVKRLYGLLFHRPGQLLEPSGAKLYHALALLRERGLVEKIGVSVYSPEELDAIFSLFRFDIVQAPFNVIDRRLLNSGWLRRLHGDGVEVHTRSVFLQGLLLMNSKSRPAQFDTWAELWSEWHRWLEDQAVDPLAGCLSFVRSFEEIDRIVIGVDSVSQLEAILEVGEIPAGTVPSSLMSNDLQLIDPSMWCQG